MKIQSTCIFIFLGIAILSFGQSYTEGADLDNVAPGPTFDFIEPEITIAGQMNTPEDGAEYFVLEVAEGCQIDAVHYSITDPNALSISGFFQFGVNNQETFSGATTSSFMNATQFPTTPFPLIGPATLQCQAQANVAFLSDWEMRFVGNCNCDEPTLPNVTADSESICFGEVSTLNFSGMLNGATAWHIYTDQCDGTEIGNTSGSSFDVTPLMTTTYLIRGEGGCATPGECQSITIVVSDEIDTSVSQNDNFLTANNTTATYQWVDCANNFNPIPDDTAPTCVFCQTNSGTYAVILTEAECVDTSACFDVTVSGIIESTFESEIMVYPNPMSLSNGPQFTIDLGENYSKINLQIRDINGRLVYERKYENKKLIKAEINEKAGVFLGLLESENKRAIIRLIKL